MPVLLAGDFPTYFLAPGDSGTEFQLLASTGPTKSQVAALKSLTGDKLAAELQRVFPKKVLDRLGPNNTVSSLSADCFHLAPLQQQQAGDAASGYQVKVLDTRVASYLYETVVRHGSIMTPTCGGKLVLAKHPSTADIEGLNSSKNRMHMDDDLWTAIAEAIEKGDADASAAEKSFKALLQYITANVSFGGVYDNNGEVTPFAKAIVLLHRVDPTKAHLQLMLTEFNRYVRLVALFFLRYLVAPEDILQYFVMGNTLWDEVVIAFNEETTGCLKEMSRSLLLEDEASEAWFPPYPTYIVEGFKQRLATDLATAPETVEDVAAQRQAAQRAAMIERSQQGGGAAHGTLLHGFSSIAQMAKQLELARRMALSNATFADFDPDDVVVADDADVDRDTAHLRKRSRTGHRNGGPKTSLKKGEFRVVPDSVYLVF